jgi:hypothetical protein
VEERGDALAAVLDVRRSISTRAIGSDNVRPSPSTRLTLRRPVASSSDGRRASATASRAGYRSRARSPVAMPARASCAGCRREGERHQREGGAANLIA